MADVATSARRRGRGLGAMLALGVALSGAPALAQSAQDLAAARQTFNEGRELEKKSAWAEALEKFKKVAGVKMTPQVRFHIALCEENLGDLAAAMRGFQLAAEEARLAGSTAAEVAEKAPPRVEALRKRVGMLKIDVTGKVASSKILLDNTPVAQASLGVEIPVNPGEHVIEVKDASGSSTFRKQLSIREQGSEQVSVEIHDEALAPPPPKVIVIAPPPPPPPSRAPVYIAGGIGLAFLLGSGALLAAEQVTIFDVTNHCPPYVLPPLTTCDPSYKYEADLGKLYLTLSQVALGVGVAGLATAGILFAVTSPKKPAPPKAAVSIRPAGPGFVIHGVF